MDQRACIDLLRDVQATPGVKHVRVASGVRFDLALKDATALAAYTGEFTGGQLKIAPEHCVPDVLDLMRKPGMKPFEAFLEAFVRYSEAHGKEQYVIPYLMSAFPGCTDAHMRQLGDWLAARNWSPRQVQCFIPTPGTVATAMYYARCTPDGAPIYVARTDEEQHLVKFAEQIVPPGGKNFLIVVGDAAQTQHLHPLRQIDRPAMGVLGVDGCDHQALAKKQLVVHLPGVGVGRVVKSQRPEVRCILKRGLHELTVEVGQEGIPQIQHIADGGQNIGKAVKFLLPALGVGVVAHERGEQSELEPTKR